MSCIFDGEVSEADCKEAALQLLACLLHPELVDKETMQIMRARGVYAELEHDCPDCQAHCDTWIYSSSMLSDEESRRHVESVSNKLKRNDADARAKDEIVKAARKVFAAVHPAGRSLN